VDGGQVGVFEERDEVSFGSFLEGSDGGGLERGGRNVQISLEILSDFSD
jgi:hypothetical protein